MQTPTFISKLSDGNVIFRLDVGKKVFFGIFCNFYFLFIYVYVSMFILINTIRDGKVHRVSYYEDTIRISQNVLPIINYY
jgi:hypothetical protein